MNPLIARRRAIAFALSMAGSAVLAQALRPTLRPAGTRVAVALEALFPTTVGPWRIDTTTEAFVRPAEEQGRLYGIYDQVLERAYLNADRERVMLSVAYGGDQSASLQMHRPEVCYAAGGFEIKGLEARRLSVGSLELPVTRLHAAMAGRSEPITYWAVLGDTAVHDPNDFQWQRLVGGLHGKVLDGMLVRVSSIGPTAEDAYRLHESFIADLAGALRPSDRARVFGAPSAPGMRPGPAAEPARERG